MDITAAFKFFLTTLSAICESKYRSALKTPLGGTAAMAGLKASGEAARTAAPVVGKAVESIASKSGAALTPAVEKSNKNMLQDENDRNQGVR